MSRCKKFLPSSKRKFALRTNAALKKICCDAGVGTEDNKGALIDRLIGHESAARDRISDDVATEMTVRLILSFIVSLNNPSCGDKRTNGWTCNWNVMMQVRMGLQMYCANCAASQTPLTHVCSLTDEDDSSDDDYSDDDELLRIRIEVKTRVQNGVVTEAERMKSELASSCGCSDDGFVFAQIDASELLEAMCACCMVSSYRFLRIFFGLWSCVEINLLLAT